MKTDSDYLFAEKFILTHATNVALLAIHPNLADGSSASTNYLNFIFFTIYIKPGLLRRPKLSSLERTKLK